MTLTIERVARNLGPNLRRLMKQSRMSQQDVADEIGVSRPLISCWVRGVNKPDVYQACSLANLFDVSVEELAMARPDRDA